jgi:ribosomal protein S27E
MTSSNQWSDGTALAGPLRDLVQVDVVTAIGRCIQCGRTAAMADVRVFDHAPSVVARCLTCDQVLLRLERGPGRAWLDLRGLTYLQVPMAEET